MKKIIILISILFIFSLICVYSYVNEESDDIKTTPVGLNNSNISNLTNISNSSINKTVDDVSLNEDFFEIERNIVSPISKVNQSFDSSTHENGQWHYVSTESHDGIYFDKHRTDDGEEIWVHLDTGELTLIPVPINSSMS